MLEGIDENETRKPLKVEPRRHRSNWTSDRLNRYLSPAPKLSDLRRAMWNDGWRKGCGGTVIMMERFDGEQAGSHPVVTCRTYVELF